MYYYISYILTSTTISVILQDGWEWVRTSATIATATTTPARRTTSATWRSLLTSNFLTLTTSATSHITSHLHIQWWWLVKNITGYFYKSYNDIAQSIRMTNGATITELAIALAVGGSISAHGKRLYRSYRCSRLLGPSIQK